MFNSLTRTRKLCYIKAHKSIKKKKEIRSHFKTSLIRSNFKKFWV